MKSAYKYELADAAGVSRRTFQRWLKENRSRLSRFGVKPTTHLLPPRAVRWICLQYGIDFSRLALDRNNRNNRNNRNSQKRDMVVDFPISINQTFD